MRVVKITFILIAINTAALRMLPEIHIGADFPLETGSRYVTPGMELGTREKTASQSLKVVYACVFCFWFGRGLTREAQTLLGSSPGSWVIFPETFMFFGTAKCP